VKEGTYSKWVEPRNKHLMSVIAVSLILIFIFIVLLVLILAIFILPIMLHLCYYIAIDCWTIGFFSYKQEGNYAFQLLSRGTKKRSSGALD